jgi:hypothetical protein
MMEKAKGLDRNAFSIKGEKRRNVGMNGLGKKSGQSH